MLKQVKQANEKKEKLDKAREEAKGKPKGKGKSTSKGAGKGEERKKYSFAVLLARRNIVLQFYWDGDIRFCSSTGIQKYSFAVLQGQKVQCAILLGQKHIRKPTKIQKTLGTQLNPPGIY